MVIGTLPFLNWLLLTVESMFAIPVLYLCVISLSSIFGRWKRANQPVTQTANHLRLAVLIPARNEESILGTLLESLAQLTYPREHYDVYVIADNCTDNTAVIAQQYSGVRVLQRYDAKKLSKGYALHWAWQRLAESNQFYDAYVIVDADSIVNPDFLHHMNQELVRGSIALQGRYTVLNGTQSPIAALRWIALTLINHVRPLGRSNLGFSAPLTGNGMCFSQEVLRRCPWTAFNLNDDYQYYLQLIQHGVRVDYVPEAVIYSLIPATFEHMRNQDIRWAVGFQETKLRTAGKLLRAGITQKSLMKVEAGVEMLTPPLTLLCVTCWLMVVAALLLGASAGILLAVVMCAGIGFYIATAFYFLHPPAVVYKALLYAPAIVAWKLWVILVLSWTQKNPKDWARAR